MANAKKDSFKISARRYNGKGPQDERYVVTMSLSASKLAGLASQIMSVAIREQEDYPQYPAAKTLKATADAFRRALRGSPWKRRHHAAISRGLNRLAK